MNTNSRLIVGTFTTNIDDILYVQYDLSYEDLKIPGKLIYWGLIISILIFDLSKVFFYTGHINMDYRITYDIIDTVMKFIFNIYASKYKIKAANKIYRYKFIKN
jgi:hypothetical protein